MRGVSKGFIRTLALLAVLAVLTEQGALAKEKRSRGLEDRFEHAKRFVVIVLSRFGLPPG